MLHTEFRKFKEYLSQNRWPVLGWNILLLLVWWPWVFNTAPRIDTEVFINEPYSNYNWLDMGRQGAILTKYIFSLRWFNPHIETLFGYLLICLASVLFGYLFWRAGCKNKVLCAAFGMFCFVAPIMTEQFYFELQIFEIALAYVLCAVAVGTAYMGIFKRSICVTAISIGCMMWIFSTYQSFVILYVAAVITCFILLYQQESERKIGWTLVWKLIAGFLCAFILNQIITKSFFSAQIEYLSGKIAWSSQTPGQSIYHILGHLAEGFFGEEPFYTPFYGILAVLVILGGIIKVKTFKGKNGKIIYLIAVIVLQTVPFWLTVVGGTIPTLRAQMAYPFVLGCDAVLLADQVYKRKILVAFSLLFSFVIGWSQMMMTERMIYTDEIRSQEDIRLASAIEERIGTASSVEKPVAIIGSYQNRLNASCIRGEMIGLSMFSMSTEVEPHYFWSGDRALQMLKVLGFSFESASQEQMLEARKQVLTMPVWPAEGSIADAGDYIIVKLSEDHWQEDLIDSKIQAANFEKHIQMVDGDALRIAIDALSTENDTLTVQGWAFLDGVDAGTVQTQLYLYDAAENAYYQLPTVRKQRPDLISAFENGQLYEYAGFYAEADIHQLEEPLKDYQLWVGIETDTEVNLMNTGYVLP